MGKQLSLFVLPQHLLYVLNNLCSASGCRRQNKSRIDAAKLTLFIITLMIHGYGVASLSKVNIWADILPLKKAVRAASIWFSSDQDRALVM